MKPLLKPRWWEDTLRSRNPGLFVKAIRRAAKLGSYGFALGVKGREEAYRRRWLSSKRLPRLTICVGNLTVGGTGKTPVVMRLASDLMARGLRPAILLRGYKRKKHSNKPVVVRTPKRVLATVSEAGDEGMELALRLPGACVGVGADRFAVGSTLLKSHPIDVFILDDGFQHYALERDVNLVTVDATDPWGGGELLPAGLLREPREGLMRATAVILTRTLDIAPDRLKVIRAEVASFLPDRAPIFESHHAPVQFFGLHGKPFPLKSLNGERVVVMSGIGRPDRFESTVEKLGGRIAKRYRAPDHGNEWRSVLAWLEKNARQGRWVVLTEKDAMRWPLHSLSPFIRERIAILRMDLLLTKGSTQWNQWVDRIARLVP